MFTYRRTPPFLAPTGAQEINADKSYIGWPDSGIHTGCPKKNAPMFEMLITPSIMALGIISG